MRRVFAIAVIAEVFLVALVLNKEIIEFIHAHPWWHTLLAAIPEIAAPILAFLELRHSGEANRLRTEANDLRFSANALQEEQNKSTAEIAKLKKELDAERNAHLKQIADNTQRPKTEAEVNAQVLRKYIGQRASVTENGNQWGGGVEIAEVSDNNIATLFAPASHYNSQAYAQLVRCDKLHIVEAEKDGCPLQVSIMERYGAHTPYGEARSWTERNVQPTHAGMPRGESVFHAMYRKPGSPKMRRIHVYASADGSPNYIMIAGEDGQEIGSWHAGKLDIEKKFAVVNVEWTDQGFQHIGGGASGNLNMYVRK